MIVVVCRYNGVYGWLDEHGTYNEYTPDEVGLYIKRFLVTACEETKKGGKTIKLRSTLYIQDLGLIGPAIHKDILKMGFDDVTDHMPKNGRMSIGSYYYLISADIGTWYGLNVCNHYGYTNSIYSLENVVGGVTNDSFLEDYKGNSPLQYLCRCHMDIIRQLAAYSGGKAPMTISSCAFHEWSERTSIYDRNDIYKDMSKIECDLYGITADEYLREAYKGGWCYCKAEPKVYRDGITLDVNSLYSYICKYKWFPVGAPVWWVGHMTDFMTKQIEKGFGMSFIHFSCKFTVKSGKLPFIQIPRDFMRRGVLSASKVSNRAGEIDEPVELILTNEEYDLFLEHYDVKELKVYDGVFFHVVRGVFSDYIDEYYELKKSAVKEGSKVKTRLYKMMLNGLSGNFAKKKIRENVILDKDGNLESTAFSETRAKSLIHIGACITSWARCFMVRLAQKNIERFLYCDTDSLHLLGNTMPVGIKVDKSELGAMKIERLWRRAVFYGEKTYIEEDYNRSWEMVYAGVPEEVQKQCENALNGMKYIEYCCFDDGVEMADEDVIRWIDRVKKVYHFEISNGTYSPSKISQNWLLDVTSRVDVRSKAKQKQREAQNLINASKRRKEKAHV